MNPEQAETVALTALIFIGADEKALRGLLAQTGTGLDDLRQRAGEPEFLAGVMDYLLDAEDLALAFCDHAGLRPEQLGAIRRALPGGETYAY